MDDGNSPGRPENLRASDRDRQHVAERLHEAAAEGRLTLDELGDRLDVAYAARTYAELVPLTLDLPARPGDPVVAVPAPVNLHKAVPVTGGTGPSVSVAMMSGCDRAGEWTVPAAHTAVAVMGGVKLDLRHARFGAPHVTITAIAFMGGIEVIVPPGLAVEVDGFGFMGGFDRKIGTGARTGGPTVRITGFAMMGGVGVRRADPEKELAE